MVKQTFESWKRAVDAEVVAKSGLSCDDIDDWCYRADYEDGVSPKRCAARALKNAREACGM